MSIQCKLWLGAMVCAVLLLTASNLLSMMLGLPMLLAGLIVLALFAPIAWMLAKLAYAPVRDVTKTARRIVLHDQLDGRCFYPGPLDDIGELVVIMNEVLVRHDAALARIIRLRAAPPACGCPREDAPLDAADLVLGLESTQPER